MSRPAHAIEQGTHVVTWGAPEQVGIEFDFFHNDVRHGELSAEATVFLTDPAVAMRIHRARVTLTSTRSRSELANHVNKLAGDYNVDWQSLIGEACDQVLDSYRSGSEVSLIRDAVAPPESTWILPPLLLSRHPTIIFGDGGVGKSLIALAAGASINSGLPLMGIEPSERKRVAYLDWEFDVWEHKQRLATLVDPMPDMVYVPCVGPLRDQVDRIRRVCRDHDIGYIIIDSIGAACGGEPESAEVALQFFEGVRRIGLGSLCIAHIIKDKKKGGDDRPFGSSFWHNMARATWLVRKQADSDANRIRVALYNKKSNSGRLSGALSYEINFDEKHTTLSKVSVYQTPELAQGVSLTGRIRNALLGGAKTYQELADELGADTHQIRSRVAAGFGSMFVKLSESEGIIRVGLIQAPPKGVQ